MPDVLQRCVIDFVTDSVGPVASTRRLGGGDVAHSYAVDLEEGGRVFAKTHRQPPPGFFTTESAGLGWLREPGVVQVPQVLAVSDEPPVLVLEWIEVGGGAGGDEARFGRELAALHRSGAPGFGRADGRTTGSRRLPNGPSETWAEFYATRRLLPLAGLAHDARALPEASIKALETVAGRLESLVGPPEAPCRLHGDLWGGNRLIDRAGESWLIDPA